VPRVCFTLQVNPDMLDEYRRRHAAVWPEMLAALQDTGWRDYSLYLRDDGLLVGVLETEDFDAIRAAMEARDVNARWQAEMAPFFADLRGRRPDEGMQVLQEIFNLEGALDRVAHKGGPTS
jgi:L-rhamnose mutarotase